MTLTSSDEALSLADTSFGAVASAVAAVAAGADVVDNRIDVSFGILSVADPLTAVSSSSPKSASCTGTERWRAKLPRRHTCQTATRRRLPAQSRRPLGHAPPHSTKGH